MTDLRYAVADLNGQARGKRVPADTLEKLRRGTARLPLSALNVDIWGADIAASPLVFESGDKDGILRPARETPWPMPWLPGQAKLMPMTAYYDNGRPFAGDPRHALARVLARFAQRGLQVVAATELEFYLIDDSENQIRPPVIPGQDRRAESEDVLGLDALDDFDAFFTDLYSGALRMGIPAQASISEGGSGQFEINLNHSDAMDCADNTWAMKMLIRKTARQHGLTATFLAKPFGDQAGSGLHVHCSVLKNDGSNIFDDGSADGTDALRHAIAGCLSAMPGAAAIFFPHSNSYDRLVEKAHAPTSIAWGYENRTTALRIPGGDPTARRIEHRVAGADANPYLLLAVILGGMLTGLEDGAEPPDAIQGDAYAQTLPSLPTDWQSALKEFAINPVIARILSAELIANFGLTKQQERKKSDAMKPDVLRHFLANRV